MVFLSENLPEYAIRCRNIWKSFGAGENQIEILHGIDLDIISGELFMISGPSGSGKTTLISIISCLLHFEKGELTLNNLKMNQTTEDEKVIFRRKNIGFVFQSYHLIPTFTVLENVSVPLLIDGWPKDAALEQAHLTLIKVGIHSKGKNYPSELSGGQRQLAAISRALVMNPKIIICDEPTSALDQVSGLRFMQLLKNIMADGNHTVIVVTHDKRIHKFADRMGIMNDGKLEEISEPEDRII